MLANGLGASPRRAASGVIVFNSEDAARMKARGRHCILVVTETGPTDIEGMKASNRHHDGARGMTRPFSASCEITPTNPCVAGDADDSASTLAELPCWYLISRRFPLGRATASPSMAPTARFFQARCRWPSRISAAPRQAPRLVNAPRRIKVRANRRSVEAATTVLSFDLWALVLAPFRAHVLLS